MNFMNEKFCILILISQKYALRGWIEDNGLVPNRRQSIICTNTDPIQWRMHAALGKDELALSLGNEPFHFEKANTKIQRQQVAYPQTTLRWIFITDYNAIYITSKMIHRIVYSQSKFIDGLVLIWPQFLYNHIGTPDWPMHCISWSDVAHRIA